MISNSSPNQDYKNTNTGIRLLGMFEKACAVYRKIIGDESVELNGAMGSRIYNPGDSQNTIDTPIGSITIKDLDGAGPDK